MPRTRRPAKVDSNQPDIVAALRRCGASVRSIAMVGDGVPDLLVGCNGENFLIEVKSMDGKLTRDETAFARDWRGAVVVIRSVDEAVAWFSRVRLPFSEIA